MHPSTALATRASHHMHSTSHQTCRTSRTSSSASTDACHTVCLVTSTHHLLLYPIQGFLRRPTGTGRHGACGRLLSRFFRHSLGHGLGRLFGDLLTKESCQRLCKDTEQTRATLPSKDLGLRCHHQFPHRQVPTTLFFPLLFQFR